MRFLTLATAVVGECLLAWPRLGVYDLWTTATGAMLCLLAVVLSLAIFCDGYTPTRLGLRIPSWQSLVTVGLLMMFLVVAVLPLGNWLLGTNVGGFEAARANLWKLPIQLFFFNAVVAIFEEFMYRGYAIARLEDLTGSTAASVSISTMAFGLAHAPGRGWALALVAIVGGAIFSIAYLWRRDVLAVATAHFAINIWIISSSQ